MEVIAILRIAANVNKLSRIRHFVQQSISQLEITIEEIDDIVLSVDEAATNIILHGYRGEPGVIEISVGIKDNSVFVRLRDEAPHFDPTQAPPPDLSLPLELRPLGKMGVFLIKQFMDEVIYEALPRRGNQLTMFKNCLPPDSRGDYK